MRHVSVLLLALAILEWPARSGGDEPAAAASAGRPRMTMLERSGGDPLADVEKAAKRRTAQRRTPRHDAAAAAVTTGPLRKNMGRPAHKTAVERGVGFLLATQGGDGGWNPHAQKHVEADVANTSIAGLALLKPNAGKENKPHDGSVRQAAAFVLRRVATAKLPDQWQPSVVDGTVSGDLGVGSDAALAALFLAERAAAGNADAVACRGAAGRLLEHIDKRLEKDPHAFRHRAQGLSRAVAAHAAVVAGRAGATVPEGLVDRLAEGCPDDQQFYGRSARIGCLHAAALESGNAPADDATALAETLVRPVLADYHGRWPYGAGGEVFLSLVFLGAMLSDTGGPTAAEWSHGVETLLVQTQNGDGSWTGSSCINSRVFCTSTALLVMNTPSPDVRVAAR